jgi:hypothetical protein
MWINVVRRAIIPIATIALIIPGEMGEGTGGVTEPLRRRIVLPFGGPLADTDHVIGHELVHAFQFDVTTNPNAPPALAGGGSSSSILRQDSS